MCTNRNQEQCVEVCPEDVRMKGGAENQARLGDVVTLKHSHMTWSHHSDRAL